MTVMSVGAQHPFSTKWMSVETPHVKIICDKSINQKDIYRVANSMERVFMCDTVSLKDDPRRIPLVLSSSSVVSNGYVTLFPYKMYFYGQPFHNNSIGTGEWYQNLAVHEYRHVVQNQITNHGLTKFASVIAGAFGRSAMRMSIPSWWFEGDAVYAETVLTSAGRGRLASFEQLTAAILDSRQKNYPYDKLVNGSFRNQIPGKYELGYQLVTHGRRIAGSDVWTKTARRSSWYSICPWAFGWSFRHFSGVNLTKNYRQTMDELRQFYSSRIDSLTLTDAKVITKKHKRRYESYSNPRFINDTTFLALKYSLTEPSRIVSVTLSGKEKTLFGFESSTFDYACGKIVWATAVPDERWTLQDFSDIAVYDLAAKQRYRLTHQGRYFSPAISPDGKLIAAVEFDRARNASLCIFKAEYIGNKISSLHQVNKIEVEYGEYLRGLRFVNNHEVAAVSNYQNKNAVVIYDVVLLQRRTVVDYTDDAINSLKPFSGSILYDSEYSGITNIWSVDVASGQCSMLTSTKYSASSPDVSPDGYTFIYSDFSATGSNIVLASLDTENAVPKDSVKPCKLEYYKPLLQYEPAQSLDYVSVAPTDNEGKFTVKDYKQYYNPVRIYGWMPSFDDDYLGFTIYSQNTLETLNMYVNQIYRTDAEYWRTTVGATYSGFYPVLGVSASFDTDGNKYYFRDRFGYIYQKYIYWDSKTVNAYISLPFNFSRFNYFRHLTITPQISRYFIAGKLVEGYTEMGNGNFNVVHGSLDYSCYRSLAPRDFKYTLGFAVKFDVMKALGASRKAEKFKTTLSVTVPGLFRQNSLTVNAGYMQQVRNYDEAAIYLFADSDFDVRGYSSLRCHESEKVSGEYSFPLGYPDVGIPAVVWIKRVRSTVFADAASNLIFGQRWNFASAGFKMQFDVNLFRIPNNVSVGFSYAKSLITNAYSGTSFSLLLSYQM